MRHRAKTGTVCTRTRYGYGVCGYGYGVKNPDPRCTRDEPYAWVGEGSGVAVDCAAGITEQRLVGSMTAWGIG